MTDTLIVAAFAALVFVSLCVGVWVGRDQASRAYRWQVLALQEALAREQRAQPRRVEGAGDSTQERIRKYWANRP